MVVRAGLRAQLAADRSDMDRELRLVAVVVVAAAALEDDREAGNGNGLCNNDFCIFCFYFWWTRI